MKLSTLTLLGPVLLGGNVVIAFAPPSLPLFSNSAKLSSSSSWCHNHYDRRGGHQNHRIMLHVLSSSSSNTSDISNDDNDPLAAIANDKNKENFQSTLLHLLERRMQDGPGSLTLEEISQFEREIDGIVTEMKDSVVDPHIEEEEEEKEVIRATIPAFSTPLSTFTRKGWWGDGGRPSTSQLREKEKESRRKSTTSFAHGNEGKNNNRRPHRPATSAEGSSPGYFSVHSTTGNDSRRPPTTKSFAHGDREGAGADRSLRSATPKEGTMPDYFQVHSNNKSHVMESRGDENCQRPIPSTDNPQHVARNHRGVGDTRDDLARTSSSSSTTLPARLSAETEERSRPIPSADRLGHARVGDHRGVGDVKDPSRSSRAYDVATKKSLIEGEERVRPVASSTNLPEYLKVADHRGVGDTKGPAKRSQQQRRSSSTTKSLVEIEERIRPVPSSDQQSAKASDHRDVGDARKHPASSRSLKASAVKMSLVETEERIRPIPSSDVPEYAKLKDHRDVGDVKDRASKSQWPLSTASGPSSLIAEEGRIRPVASSSLPEYAHVKDRRSVGDMKDPAARRSRSSSSAVAKSLIENEERIRPVASSFANREVTPDHRGPGDMHTLTRQRLESSSSSGAISAAVASLSEAERRVRPAPRSTRPSQNDRVALDHRGPGDMHTLTRQRLESSSSNETASSVTATSLSEAEQRVRPWPGSSRLSENERLAPDHRGPGDTHSLTKKHLESLSSRGSSSSFTSLSEAEQSVRPVSSTSRKAKNDQVADHRGPGDTHSLTKQRSESSSSSLGTASLSEAEQRVRPAPSSTDQRRNVRVSDRRCPGDTNTLTKKLASSSPQAVAASLSAMEQAVRPTVPSSNQFQKIEVSDHRGPGDYTRTLTEKLKSSPSAPVSASLSLDEQRQRPVPSYGSVKNAQQHSTVTDRTGDVNIVHEKSPLVASESTETASLGDGEQWWTEKTQRPRANHFSNSRNNSKVLNRALESTQEVIKTSTAAFPSEEPSDAQQSALQSLLKEEKYTTSVSNNRTIAKPPFAVLQPSSLRELLKDEPPPIVGIKNESTFPISTVASSSASSSPLSSLLKEDRRSVPRPQNESSPTYELKWWNKKPIIPQGYADAQITSSPYDREEEDNSSHEEVGYGDEDAADVAISA